MRLALQRHPGVLVCTIADAETLPESDIQSLAALLYMTGFDWSLANGGIVGNDLTKEHIESGGRQHFIRLEANDHAIGRAIDSLTSGVRKISNRWTITHRTIPDAFQCVIYTDETDPYASTDPWRA